MSIHLAADAVLKRLKAQMPPLLQPDQIGLCSPADAGDRFLLGAFVYGVSRDARSQANGPVRIDASTSVKAPLNTELRVMFTPYVGKKSGLLDDYRIIDRLLRIWHDDSEVPLSTAFQPSHAPNPRMALLSLGADDISKIWQFPGVPYALSLFYSLAPVSVLSQSQTTIAPVGDVRLGG